MQHAATTLGAARRSWDKISPSPEGAAWENPARQRREAAGGTNRVRLADGSSFVRRRSRKLSMLETGPTVFHNPAVQPSHRSARRRAKPPENLLAQREGIAGLCQSMYQKIQRNPMQTKILRLTYFFSRIANTMKPARDCFEGFYGFERQNFFTNLKPARTRNTEGFRKFF
jgi:hypothetical protein